MSATAADNRRPAAGAEPQTSGPRRWPLALILLLALGLRLLLWGQPLHEPANDEVEYIAVARDLLAGRGWVFYESYRWLRAPLYPLFLAGSLWLAGGDGGASFSDALHRAALPGVALSVANVYLTYRLARRLVGERAALPAALAAAVLWTNATFASLYMAETLFTFLFQAGLLAALRAGGVRRAEEGAPAARPATQRWWPAVLSGALFGLATLTRSVTLLFLPAVALWLLWQAARGQGTAFGVRRATFGVPLAFLACAALTIAPWTVRNMLAYGAPIAVETGLSYNMWLFNEPRESKDEIHRALEGIRNPAERADYATARGLERLREDPLIVARKLWPNWVFLARVKPIQDRFLLQSYYASVELPPFVAALVFDDLLYVALVLAAIVGLARGRPPWIVLAWLGYCVGTMLLTHGEARYRHFLFPLLIPYAALALVRWRALAASMGARRLAAVGALWAVFLWTVLTAYPWDWAGWNLARGGHTLAGDARWALGNRAGALASYERAIEAEDAPDAWLRLGHARRAAGDLAGAADAYRRAWRREPLYFVASTWYGDALRALGDEPGARRAFAGTYADPARVAEYAWQTVRPAPRPELDVGGGLDAGFVRGLYPAEELGDVSARWTDGQATIRLSTGAAERPIHEGREGAEAGDEAAVTSSPGHPATLSPSTQQPTPDTRVLRLRLAAPRPDGAPTQVEVCAAGACRSVAVGGGWRTYELPLALPGSGEVRVELRGPTFRAADGRELGVLVDWASVE